MVFYEIQQALGSGFWTPTRIRQESSFKYKHATVYSECIAEYTHSCNETFCLLRIAVRSHMWRWQHGWVYSHLSIFSPPLAFFFFLSFPFLPILSMSSADPLPLVTDPQRQSALFCLSAIVYRHKNTNGQQLKAINSFEVDPLCAWHQPPWLLSPNTSRSIAAVTPTFSTQNLPGIILKATGL